MVRSAFVRFFGWPFPKVVSKVACLVLLLENCISLLANIPVVDVRSSEFFVSLTASQQLKISLQLCLRPS